MTPDWIYEALCRGRHAYFWFPPPEVPNSSQFYVVGKAVCERCPVWKECLSEGKEEVIGMWGGLGPNERGLTASPVWRNHGTVSRFRQGCKCSMCESASKKKVLPLDMRLIPLTGENFVISEVKERVQKSLA